MDLSHLCLLKSRWMDTLPLYCTGASWHCWLFQMAAVVWRVQGWWSCAMFVWPCFNSAKTDGSKQSRKKKEEEEENEEGEGCGWGWSESDLMTGALSGAATLIRMGLSQTMVGVTGPWRPGMRGLMSQYWAEWSWSATAGSDGPDTAVCQFVCLAPGRRQQKPPYCVFQPVENKTLFVRRPPIRKPTWTWISSSQVRRRIHPHDADTIGLYLTGLEWL